MENDKGQLRRDDLKTGILLILLSLGVLWEASSYPMTDSYGGVQNVWYVSPALFPIIIGLLLLILALVLVGNAIAYHGLTRVWRDNASDQSKQHHVDLRFVGVAVFFSAFVYGYVSAVDFFIASAYFLFCFVSGYYLKRTNILIINIISYTLIAFVILIITRVSSEPAVQWLTDGLTTFGLISQYLILNNSANEDTGYRTRLRWSITVSILVPAILIPVFKFGLLVPLPSEGIYIDLMEQIRYLFRSNS